MNQQHSGGSVRDEVSAGLEVLAGLVERVTFYNVFQRSS